MCLSYVDWIHLAVPFCLLIVPSTIHTAAALLFTHACTPAFDKTSATTQNNIKIHVVLDYEKTYKFRGHLITPELCKFDLCVINV